MSDLNPRETELVALGAALGSNCVPCIEYHIPQARKAGLSDREIDAAIQHADKVRQVPARKVLETALKLLSQPAGDTATVGPGAGCGCGIAGAAAQGAEPASTDRTFDAMAAMMSRMKSSCGASAGAAGAQNAVVKDQETRAPQGGGGCC